VIDLGQFLYDVPGWWEQASCRGCTALFYRNDRMSQMVAASICQSCPVLAECEVETRRIEMSGRRFGVRAGFTPEERAAWCR
jgi:Transcription factor WhiB